MTACLYLKSIVKHTKRLKSKLRISRPRKLHVFTELCFFNVLRFAFISILFLSFISFFLCYASL